MRVLKDENKSGACRIEYKRYSEKKKKFNKFHGKSYAYIQSLQYVSVVSFYVLSGDFQNVRSKQVSIYKEM